MNIKQSHQELAETARVLDDRFRRCFRGGRIAIAGGEAAKKDLRVTLDERERCAHVVPRHLEDVFPKSLEVALLGDVTEHDHTPLQGALRRSKHRSAETQDASFAPVELDLGRRDVRAQAQRLDHRDERRGDLARRDRPLLDPLAFEGLPQDEARGIQAEEVSGGPIQPDDRAARVYDQERVVHAREHCLELKSVTLVLQGQLFRGAEALDGDGGLRRDGAQVEHVPISVGFRPIALHRKHTEDSIA